MVGRSQVYRRDQYCNSRHSGAIGLLMVCGSAVPVQGRFRRQIGTESCHRVGSYAYRHEACRVAGHISCNSYWVYSCHRYWQFFFLWVASVTAVPTASPLYHFLYPSFMVPFMRSSCLNYAGSHLYSHLRNYRSFRILLYAKSSRAY